MPALDPFEQRPGVVQPEADAGMPLQVLDKGQIRTLVGVLKHCIEIAYRLVRVDQENEMEFRCHLAYAARSIIIACSVYRLEADSLCRPL